MRYAMICKMKWEHYASHPWFPNVSFWFQLLDSNCWLRDQDQDEDGFEFQIPRSAD